MKLTSARVLWDMVDGPMPRGLLGVGVGDLHGDDEHWTLFLGGFSTTFRNRLYTARAPRRADPATAPWTLDVDARGRAAALIEDAAPAAWDRGGMHTPSYVPASAEAPARIYYAGRASRRHVGPGSSYAIGVLEEHQGRWVRRTAPILTGRGPRPSVLEPRVLQHGDRYIMWFLAAPHEVAPGEQPDYELRSSTSANGISGWTTPEVFALSAEGFFDVAPVRLGETWAMLLARGTNLHGTAPYPPQGLWIMHAETPSPRRTWWSAPERILDTDTPDTPAWMGSGVCDPAAVVDAAGTLTVFVSGTRACRSWSSLTLEQLRRFKKPPVPAPFFLSAAALRFSDPGRPAPG